MTEDNLNHHAQKKHKEKHILKLRQPTAILVSFPSFLLPLLGLHSNSPAKVTTQFYTAMLAGDDEIACSLTTEESRPLVSKFLSLNHEESKRHPEKYVKYENATASVLAETVSGDRAKVIVQLSLSIGDVLPHLRPWTSRFQGRDIIPPEDCISPEHCTEILVRP